MATSKSKHTIDLTPLYGSKPVEFYFSSTIDNDDKEVKQELKYLLDTMRLLLQDIPMLHSTDAKREKLEKQLENNNFTTFDLLEKVVNNFNRYVNNTRLESDRQRERELVLKRAKSNSSQSSASPPESTVSRQQSDEGSVSSSSAQLQVAAPDDRPKCNRVLLEHILSLCYWRAVEDPEALNRHYKAFTSQTYGETSFEYVELVLQRVEFLADDIFIDLGSGVGQVVLHVAASLKCKRCIGIELADLPATIACKMENEFKKWMDFFGKPYTPFEIIHGDFLADEYAEMLRRGTVLFANNFAFEPKLDDALKLRFEELQEGARIISSKAFCSSNHRLSERSTKDVGAMMRVQEFSPMKGGVSWTANEFKYFLHIIDRTKVEDFFKEQQVKSSDLKQSPRLPIDGSNKSLLSKSNGVVIPNLKSARKIMQRAKAHQERRQRKGRSPANAAHSTTLRPRNKFSPVPRPRPKKSSRSSPASSSSGARRLPGSNFSLPTSSASSRGSSIDRGVRPTTRSSRSNNADLTLTSMNDSTLSSQSGENKRSQSSGGSPESSTLPARKSSSSSSTSSSNSSTTSASVNKRRYTGPSAVSSTSQHSKSARSCPSNKAQEAPIGQTIRNGAAPMASKSPRNVLMMASRAVPRRKESSESSSGAGSGSGSSSELPHAPQADDHPPLRSLKRPMELFSAPGSGNKSTNAPQPPPAALPSEVTDEIAIDLPSKGSGSKRRRRAQSRLSVGAQRKRRRGNAKRLLASTPTLGIFHHAARSLTTSPEPPTLPALSPDSSDGAALSSSTARFNSPNQEVRHRPVSEERKLTVDGLRLEIERTHKESEAEDEKLIDDFYYKVLRPELLSHLPQIRNFAASSCASSNTGAATTAAAGGSGPSGSDSADPADNGSMERLRERLENVRRDHMRICSEICQLIRTRLAIIPLASDGNNLVLELLLHSILRLLVAQPIPNSAFSTPSADAPPPDPPTQAAQSPEEPVSQEPILIEPISPLVATPPSTIPPVPIPTLLPTPIPPVLNPSALPSLADQPHNSSAPPTPKKKLSPRVPGRPRGRPPRCSESSNSMPISPPSLPTASRAASPAAIPSASTVPRSTPSLPPASASASAPGPGPAPMILPTFGVGQVVRPLFTCSPALSGSLPLMSMQPNHVSVPTGGSPSIPQQLMEFARVSCSQAPIPMRFAALPASISLPIQRTQLFVPSARPVPIGVSAIPTVDFSMIRQAMPQIQFSPPNKQSLPPQLLHAQQRQIPISFAAQYPAAPGILAPVIPSTVLLPPAHLVGARPPLTPQMFANSFSQ